MRTKQEQAAHLLQFYMQHAWEAAGLKWQGDNDAETAAVVDLIIEAAGHRAPAPVLPELDRECGTCNGKGWFHTFDNHGEQISPPDGVTCRDCGGEGHPLTDAGRDLLRFLQRHPAALTRT